MDGNICYINTDLDLKSADDLTALAGAFVAMGVRPLHVTHCEDKLWYAIFETSKAYDQPEPNIVAMLAAIEALTEPLQVLWSGCLLREFNIGYDCGAEPWAFNQGLSNPLLGRMAAVGASLRFTLYPERAPHRAPKARKTRRKK